MANPRDLGGNMVVFGQDARVMGSLAQGGVGLSQTERREPELAKTGQGIHTRDGPGIPWG